MIFVSGVIVSVISWRSVYWWRKPKYQDKTTDLHMFQCL